MMFPSVMTFPVDGVHLNPDQSYVCNKKNCTVVLDGLKRKSTGSYRCEISGDAPEFHVVHETANMTVAGNKQINTNSRGGGGEDSLVIPLQFDGLTVGRGGTWKQTKSDH